MTPDIPTLEQLNEPDVTVDMVRQYVVNAYPDAPLPVEQFVTEADLGNLRWLQSWWQPEHITPEPPHLPAPMLTHFLIGYQFGHSMDTQMQRFYLRCFDHCREHGLDTANPSKVAPKKRFADPAQRMAHARAHRKVRVATAAEVVVDPALVEARAALAQLEEDYDKAKALVKHHYDAMIAASTDRDHIKLNRDAQLSIVKQLAAKQ
jgi:hypothetical protein